MENSIKKLTSTVKPINKNTATAAVFIMADNSQGRSNASEVTLSMMPTEIFFKLFAFVPPKDMIRCRQVCAKWRDIIDAILKDGSLWESFCMRDYSSVYKNAMWKTPNITNWFEMYRSLSLWSQLSLAHESIDEFCHSDTIDEEMRSAVVQSKGVIMVHKRTRVTFHDILSLEVVKRKGFNGQFISLLELEDVVVMLGLNAQLHVINKPDHDWRSDLLINTDADDEIWFNDVKSFIVRDRTVFYSTYRQQLYSFHLDDDKASIRINLPEHLSEGIPDGLGAIGYIDGCLYILTMTENMYVYVNKQVFLKFSLDTVTNLMDCLYQHNMLENLDWRHYYILLGRMKHKPHIGELQYISKMHVYGDDVFFVGSQSGKVHVYYKPIVDGQLNLTQFKPIREYNFTTRIDIPILSVYPILNFEVTETNNGHIVLVCMPRKILVITYRHDFERPVSKAVLPYMGLPAYSG